MQFGWNRSRRAGLLARQTEVTDKNRLGGIAQVVNLRHAAGAPFGRAGNEERDPRVAFPETFVSIPQSADHNSHATWLSGIGHVPDFMGGVAEAAKQIDLASVCPRQLAAVAHASHLRPAGLARARCRRLARDVCDVLRLLRIGYVDDRRAVVFRLAGYRIHLRPTVMTNVRNPAITLLVDRWLVCTPGLQIV